MDSASERSLDVASTILGFCFVDQDEGADLWAVFDPALYSALFEGYTSVRSFTPEELAQVDAALKYVGLTQPVWSMFYATTCTCPIMAGCSAQ